MNGRDCFAFSVFLEKCMSQLRATWVLDRVVRHAAQPVAELLEPGPRDVPGHARGRLLEHVQGLPQAVVQLEREVPDLPRTATSPSTPKTLAIILKSPSPLTTCRHRITRNIRLQHA